MAERKPKRPEASVLLIPTIETDANHGVYTKLEDLNKLEVTNVTNKGGNIFNRREK